MRIRLSALCMLFFLASCDSDTLEGRALENAPVSSGSTSFADGSNNLPAPTTGRRAIYVDSRLLSTNANASEADLVLTYRIDSNAAESVGHATRVRVELNDASGATTLLTREAVADDTLSGEVEVTVPVTGTPSTITIGLEGLSGSIIDDLPAFSVLSLPTVLRRQSTDLADVEELKVTVVPDSYSSALENNRRVHRFAVEVEGKLGTSADNPYHSISGLEDNVARHFRIEEGGLLDVESPVTVDYSRLNTVVYLVLDVSSSIVHSGAAHDLLDSVARSIIALAEGAEFDIRVFAGDVYQLGSLREINFDDLTESATAFYYALDTTLDDIDSRGLSNQNSVLISFTDGRDFSSLNYFPAFRSQAQMQEYIEQRLRNVKQAQDQFYGQQLDTYFVSLGSNVDSEALQKLATESGGLYLPTFENSAIENAFAGVTNNIRGVYYLEYSSQRTSISDDLELTVTIADHSDVVLIDVPDIEPGVPGAQ